MQMTGRVAGKYPICHSIRRGEERRYTLAHHLLVRPEMQGGESFVSKGRLPKLGHNAEVRRGGEWLLKKKKEKKNRVP